MPQCIVVCVQAVSLLFFLNKGFVVQICLQLKSNIFLASVGSKVGLQSQ